MLVTSIGALVAAPFRLGAALVRALLPEDATAMTVLKLTAGIAALGVIGFGVARGLPHLNAYAEAKGMIDPAKVRIVFANPPAWMPPATLDDLAMAAHGSLASGNPLEGGALVRVHQGLVRTGWFSHVEQVRRRSESEIAVTATFRVPFAMVRTADADHLIDAAGRRLPLSYAGTARRPALPLVLGVEKPMPEAAGDFWLGADLRAALNVADLLRSRVWFASGQVRAIDASRFTHEGIVELVTDRDTRIVWGGDPSDRSLSEMPPERKLACLDALYRASKRVDDASGRTLDLRFDVVTLAPKPLSQADEMSSDDEDADSFASRVP